jgi:cupin 2 domain-containing protein
VLSSPSCEFVPLTMENFGNLFDGIPEPGEQEAIGQIVKGNYVRIERIVSHGQASPPGFWYDQDEHEWVTVLTGQAVLRLDGQSESVVLSPGDTLHLPAHCRHRVERTDPLTPTIWLAVFWKE